MITLAKRGKYYTLTIKDNKDNTLKTELSWEQMAKLYCLISGIVCRRIRGTK